MFYNAKTVEGFRRFCQSKIEQYERFEADFELKKAEDLKVAAEYGQIFANRVYWMEWHAIETVAFAVAAKEAADILRTLKTLPAGSDEDKVPEHILSHAITEITKEIRLNSRSTSASSNLVEDARRGFWTEVFSLLK